MRQLTLLALVATLTLLVGCDCGCKNSIDFGPFASDKPPAHDLNNETVLKKIKTFKDLVQPIHIDGPTIAATRPIDALTFDNGSPARGIGAISYDSISARLERLNAELLPRRLDMGYSVSA